MKRTLSILLAVLMVFAALPLTVGAVAAVTRVSDVNTAIPQSPDGDRGCRKTESLAAALNFDLLY